MTLRESYPLYLGNRPATPNLALAVHDKHSGEIATRVPLANAAMTDQAIAAAHTARADMRALPPWQRRDILNHCVERFQARAEEFAHALTVEAGKPLRDSRGEVSRLIDTFRCAAEESTRIDGGAMNLEISERTTGYQGFWKRVPIGVCSFITPFNFPLNLAAHKIAPAIAAGCPFVLKPASRTPVGALLIGEVLGETALPEGAFSILPLSRSDADPLTTDPRLAMLSFTGSSAAGWDLRSRAGRKKVVLELGGNAACIVDRDTVENERDFLDAVERIRFGSFYQSGQSCVSVQRVIVHEEIYPAFRDRLLQRTEALTCGSPHEESTDIGPMISEEEAIRVEEWIRRAERDGARVLCGGTRKGPMLSPALVENVPDHSELIRREVFGPVAVLQSYRRFEDALAMANDTDFGLQAGVFTRDTERAMQAWETLEVGGVIVGDVPSWRADHMPYGGVKQSGTGREGVRFSIEAMTEMRFLAMRRRG